MNLRRISTLAASLALVAVGVLATPPVHAATASPTNLNVDCTNAAPVLPNQTFTGNPGDTFTITNQSGADACTIAGWQGVVTSPDVITGGPSDYLASTIASAFTIVTSGSFTLTRNGVTGTITRRVGNQLAWLTGTCWIPASNQPP